MSKETATRIKVTRPIDSRLPDPTRKDFFKVPWAMKGELFMNCSCTMFCPCVVSLGAHPPTEGHCHTWMAIQVDNGHFDGEPLDGASIGLLVDIPGRMGQGGWKVYVYVDESVSNLGYHGLLRILSGKAGGTTGILDMLISDVLGAERTKVLIEREGTKRRIIVGRKIQGEIEQVLGHEDQPVVVKNTKYWMGPDIWVARGTHSKLRDRGRVWDFSGKSAEICPIDWSGPGKGR